MNSTQGKRKHLYPEKMSSVYQIKRFNLMSQTEVNIEKANALDRLARLAAAHEEWAQIATCQGDDPDSEELEAVRFIHGIPKSVYLFEDGEMMTKKEVGFYTPQISKFFSGRAAATEVYEFCWSAEESYQFDWWWVMFNQGVGYYTCAPDIEIDEPVSDLVRFATRKRKRK